MVLLALPLMPNIGLSKALQESVIVNWRKLASLKLGSMEKSLDIQALENQMVRIVGYIMPLEGDEKSVTEFLLVPSLPACIHVPPPPPNQTVYVKMQAGKKATFQWSPMWVEGILKVAKQESAYGEAYYEMVGINVEPF